MTNTPYLSYSGRKCYTTCPKKYEYRYILKEKDMSDPRSSMFGIAIGKVFEWFYNQRIWASHNCLDSIMDLIEPAIESTLKEKQFDSVADPVFVTSLRHDLRKFIPSGLDSIRSHRLLTICSRSEVDLTISYYNKDHNMMLRIGGRADFIHSASSSDVWIVDGKGSAYRDKYIDTDQVIWYAMQYFLKYHIAPTRLGFLYYRFPDDPIQWVAYDAQSIRDQINKTFEAVKQIKEKKFDPKPSRDCRLCGYNTKCADGIKYMSERRISPSIIDSSVFSLEILK